ncbi:hypothetical protein BJ508DRAFT_335471 [Ascobolus immersus RN42]|uniref:Actin-like ATPase domain-containing protein n=1 Tax=Ascobolus immersus RN42 TaxID=1160509 RepID=A0A3N4HIF5_ASCIM|nr:hypothetical protein BJ508DRAFT_335471 [Ascobolus immersus RN42]
MRQTASPRPDQMALPDGTMRQTAAVSPKPVLAIAIDFGTSFSGISYKEAAKPYSELSKHFTSWPGISRVHTYYKVPTALAFPHDPNGEVLWGFAADKILQNPEPEYIRCVMFKPHLHDANDRIIESDSFPLSLPPGKTVADVTGIYLDLLFSHFEKEMKDSYSRNVFDYHILFTVPATFSETSTEGFRRIIAEKTEIGKQGIQFEVGTLTEPQAAAMHMIYEQPESEFADKPTFIVCDAGGGTVDVCSYQVIDASNPPNYKLDQVAVAEADYCGSALIEIAFQRFLLEEVGSETLSTATYAEKEKVRQLFIQHKEEFEDDPGRPNLHIALPSSLLADAAKIGQGKTGCISNKGGRALFLAIPRSSMREYFAESVNGAVKLLKSQLDHLKRQSHMSNDKPLVKYIYLVGGLGTSRYLKQAIQERISEIYPDIRVISPHSAHLAVLDGAARVLRQRLNVSIPDPIRTKLLQSSYGILVCVDFNPDIHDKKSPKVFKDAISGKRLVRDQISWFIKRGDSYDGSAKIIPKHLERTFNTPGVYYDQFVTSKVARDKLPRELGDDVRVVCKLKSDFSTIPKEELDVVKKEVPGTLGVLKRKKGYEAKFVMIMKLAAANVEFETQYKGQRRSDLLAVEWNLLEEARDTSGFARVEMPA